MTEGERLIRKLARSLRELRAQMLTMHQGVVAAVDGDRADVYVAGETAPLEDVRLFGGGAAAGGQVWLLRKGRTQIAVGQGVHPRAAARTLTERTSGKVNSYVSWAAGEDLPLSLPGVPGLAIVRVVGFVANNTATTTRRIASVKAQTSVDLAGYVDGPVALVEVHGNDQRNAMVGAVTTVNITEGQTSVTARAQVQQTALGTAGDLVFSGGTLTVEFFPMAS